jgi:hypothetical protein
MTPTIHLLITSPFPFFIPHIVTQPNVSVSDGLRPGRWPGFALFVRLAVMA